MGQRDAVGSDGLALRTLETVNVGLKYSGDYCNITNIRMISPHLEQADEYYEKIIVNRRVTILSGRTIIVLRTLTTAVSHFLAKEDACSSLTQVPWASSKMRGGGQS